MPIRRAGSSAALVTVASISEAICAAARAKSVLRRGASARARIAPVRSISTSDTASVITDTPTEKAASATRRSLALGLPRPGDLGRAFDEQTARDQRIDKAGDRLRGQTSRAGEIGARGCAAAVQERHHHTFVVGRGAAPVFA
jgi:hypothetical protein